MQTLYEADSAWTQSDLQNYINGGVHIINHLGHGNVPYAMQFYSDDIINLLTNTDLFIVYSQACLAGAFDDDEKDSDLRDFENILLSDHDVSSMLIGNELFLEKGRYKLDLSY